MEWLRLHPYTVALIGSALVVFIGAYFVAQRVAVAPDSSVSRNWGNVGGTLSDPIANALAPTTNTQQNLYTQVRSGPPYVWSGTQNTQDTPADTFDFDAFVASLTKPPANTGATVQTDAGVDAYSFIPGGMISTSTPQKPRTPDQVALHEYGNEAGGNIQFFEETHASMPQTLKDQFEDRGNPAKNAALIDLGNALAHVGQQLSDIEAPGAVATANKNLAESYKEIGGKLALIPNAQGDLQLITAMRTYDDAVDKFVKNYVALATLLSVSGVTFSADEPGSVFTFSAASF